MSFSYVVKGAEAANRQVTVLFEPALSGCDEVKPRLLAMKLEAEEALGMVTINPVTELALTFILTDTMPPSHVF